MKNLLIAAAFIITGLLTFKLGLKIGSNSNAIENINEIHFVNPKYIRRSEPTFQMYLLKVLKDSLKNIKPPYTNERLNKVLLSIEQKTNLKNFITLLSVDSNKFKIVVSENKLDSWQSPFFLVNQDSVYYLKPLRIRYDLAIPSRLY